MRAQRVVSVVPVLVLSACASLGPLAQIVQPPRFAEAPDRASEIRLVAPGAALPVGGAAVRIWTRVTNPNPVGFTLSTLRAELTLEGTRAASGEFPLGLPLTAGGESVIPLDLSISFSDLPRLADVVRRAVAGDAVAYGLNGTIGVDAGPLGRPVFGPMPLFSGTLQVAATRRPSL
jgi:hypothetical protein